MKTTLEADTVLLSVGQSPDLSFLDDSKAGLELDGRGWLACDPEELSTGAEGVFVAGDLAYGTKLLIHAVESGKKAARHVFRYLTGREVGIQPAQAHTELFPYAREQGYEAVERMEAPTEDVSIRLSDPARSVEQTYDEEHAGTEASRCFHCNVNTIFDSRLCILCGGCADICPQRCFKLVPLKNLDFSEEQKAVAAQHVGEDWGNHTAIVKDEEGCLRCGLCAQRCPVNAITMERMDFSEAWS